MKKLLAEIKTCTLCKAELALGPNPVVTAHKDSKIVLVGQAPGTAVHKSGIPWDDRSGERLRKWLNVSKTEFYDPKNFAIIPMGFCYPGKGKWGDLPPTKICAPLWHEQLISKMPNLEMFILIGAHAQKYYLGKQKKSTLTNTVLAYEEYLPKFFPLVHPSPRNRIWMNKNLWFEEQIIPVLQEKVLSIL